MNVHACWKLTNPDDWLILPPNVHRCPFCLCTLEQPKQPSLRAHPDTIELGKSKRGGVADFKVESVAGSPEPTDQLWKLICGPGMSSRYPHHQCNRLVRHVFVVVGAERFYCHLCGHPLAGCIPPGKLELTYMHPF